MCLQILTAKMVSFWIKAIFIIPTDAHNFKITGIFKTIKMPTIAPTCFGSRRYHNQGAISCLAKTTIMVLLCSPLMTWSVLWRHIGLEMDTLRFQIFGLAHFVEP